jgi:hypothetical protein
MIDVTDGGGGERMKYLAPEHTYETELMMSILEAGYRFMRNEIMKAELLEKLELTKVKFNEFRTKQMPAIIDQLESNLRNNITADYCRQMLYLVKKGAMLFEDGVADVESFFTSDNREVFMRGFIKMQEGNDYMALAQEVVHYHLNVIDSEMARLQMENQMLSKKIEAARKEQEAQGSPPEKE